MGCKNYDFTTMLNVFQYLMDRVLIKYLERFSQV